ncbi:MAG: homoserine kinase [Actinobacteria bacterium]|nr:MAG: homoserine kinase [Actinomycetota bacterium]
MTRFRAPATTANLGAGFDVAGAALDLWNELELTEGDGADESHLGVHAFSVYASPADFKFEWTDRIPRARGLGSSAAIIALGLVAGAWAAGVEPSVEELLEAGLPLEGHADNLAPALAGGVCLTWDGHIARVADDLPGLPIAVIPEESLSTAASRQALPDAVPREDAVLTVARAALLGASIASSDARLFAASNEDRLHEPYRAATAPHLLELRSDLPEGALGATLSGSGPTVIVWAEQDISDELRSRYPQHEVLALRVSADGAARTPED